MDSSFTYKIFTVNLLLCLCLQMWSFLIDLSEVCLADSVQRLERDFAL